MEPGAIYETVRQILTHALAFGILLFIMAKFVWGPFLRLLDDRSAKIGEEFDKAEEQQAKFERLREEYEQRLAQIEEQVQARVNEAVAEGQKIRDEIVAKAGKEAADMRARVERETSAKLDAAAIELKELIVSMTISATEKVLRESIDAEKHKNLIGEFIDRVGSE